MSAAGPSDWGGMTESDRLRAGARSIWEAAIRAVDPFRLVSDRLAVESWHDSSLLVGDPDPANTGRGRPDAPVLSGIPAWRMPPIPLDEVERIVVVGGGKAVAGLAAGFESLLGAERLSRHAVSGLVSVPEGCVRRLAGIDVRTTRPAGENLPTPAVVEATAEMLAALDSLGPHDLGVVLLSGGGSALLEAPRPGVSLEEVIRQTRRLSEEGATIAELNAARSRLSLVKGGGLAGATGAGRLLVIVLSDVVGDDPRVIASGPCMPPDGSGRTVWTTPRGCVVCHCLVGGNATAVEAAALTAGDLGYGVRLRRADPRLALETAAEAGGRLAAEGIRLAADARRTGRPQAVVEGGEAVVRLPADHGRGGRNQQTVIAAAAEILAAGAWPPGLLLASIGTDGEDGPTDAAGGFVDEAVARAMADRPGTAVADDGSLAGLRRLAVAVARHDAHPLLDHAGGLVRTGPTGTNVADLRLMLALPDEGRRCGPAATAS
jgi:glycerate 2-kinase